METATLTVEIWNGSSWTDVSSDVLNGISWTRGSAADNPTSRVASTGTFKFRLKNSSTNSQTTAGYYSPGHGSAPSWFELGQLVRLKSTYSAADRYQFYGKIAEIHPTEGKNLQRYTSVTAVDYMDELATRFIDPFSLQTDKRSDQLITTLIAAMDTAPLATSYDTGPDTFSSAFHDLQGERQTAISVANKIVMSDMSRLWVRGDATGGETLTLLNRQDDIGKSSQLTLNNTMLGVDVIRDRSQIYNRAVAAVRTPAVGTSNEILYTYPEEITLNPTRSFSFTALYVDPDGGARISGKDVVTPVIDTDYKMSSVAGGGNNLNSDLDVTITKYSDRATVTLTNDNVSSTGYINLFQIRGLALRLRTAVEQESTSSASITSYGERRLTYSAPYQSNSNTAMDIATYITSKYADPQNKIGRVEYTGNVNATLMAGAVNRDLGDMITVTETQTGLSSEKRIIIGLTVTVNSGIWRVSYLTTYSDDAAYWLLGDVGFSELGDTTTLGF